MTRFEALVERGARELESALLDQGASSAEAERRSHLIGELGLPALISFLGNASAGVDAGAAPPHSGELIERLAERVAEDTELPQPEVERLLRDLLVRRVDPADAFADPARQEAFFRKLVEHAAEQSGLALSPDELDQAAELLQTGQFFEDAASSTAAIVRAVPGIPLALISDALSAPFGALRLGAAAAIDLARMPTAIPSLLADLEDGSIDRPPAILERTFRRLYAFSSLAATAQTLREILAKPSPQFAIALWAQANGLPVTPEAVGKISAGLFDTENPDLGPALVAAWEALSSRLGADPAEALVRRLAASA